MRQCISCGKKYDPSEFDHPKVCVCSLACLKQWKEKNNVSYKSLDIRMVYNPGKGHPQVKGEDKDEY